MRRSRCHETRTYQPITHLSEHIVELIVYKISKGLQFNQPDNITYN